MDDNGDGTLTDTSPNQSGLDRFTDPITDGLDADTATVRVRIVNRAPDCSLASPSIATIWPPNHSSSTSTSSGSPIRTATR